MTYITIRYHPAAQPIAFTEKECAAAIKQAERELHCRVSPKKQKYWRWYLEHSVYSGFRVISRARDLLFLWREIR